MPVNLDKAPRAFTVFLLDEEVFGVTLTPHDDDERDALHLDAYFGMCLHVYEVTAIDRYDASINGTAAHTRIKAINEAIERAEA
ncbi:hypothetical protein [Streptomyces sp. NPDC047981]|uniref:hypothetical protein n=1 Tax=Streptomyces sp. NPDC047981 TaxID=3154610 RepID=UPI00342D40B2